MPEGWVVGVDIGGTKTAVSRWKPGRLESLARFPTGGPDETLAQVEQTIASLGGDFRQVGVACGGPLDTRAGLILSPPNLPGWDRVPVVRRLARALRRPVSLMNDANANALAEWRFGAGRGVRSMLFLTAGTGMGVGVILDGRLYEGACGNAGEAGHWRLAAKGPVGFNKAGSFEGFCSGGGLAQLVAFLPRRERPRDLRAWRRRHPTAKEIAAAAGAGDRVARAVFAESGRRYGQALALLIDAFNPEKIVIGSLYVRCREYLEPEMRRILAAEALPDSLRKCRIVPAKLGERVGDYGAICAALYGSCE